MKVIYSFFVFLLFTTSVFGKILRVGYSVVPALPAVDYLNFYAAHQAAANGDTIYVFPGSSLSTAEWPAGYDAVIITKRLFICSKGFWLDSSATPAPGNYDLQASNYTANLGGPSDGFGAAYVLFDVGSQGSVLSGFDLNGRQVRANANDITIRRNWNVNIDFSGYTGISNLVVENNYRVTFSGTDNKNHVWTNVIIRNNFIYQMDLPAKTFSGIIANNTWARTQILTDAQSGGDLSMSRIVNTGGGFPTQYDINLSDGTWAFENNIIAGHYNNTGNLNYRILGGINTFFSYNVALQSTNFTIWPASGVGNIFVPLANVGNIFEGFPAIGNRSADDRYILKAGSPALQVSRPGSNADAGMYGGTHAYKLSMIPSIPTIYKINSPQGISPTGNTIQINISTRSNN